MQHVNVLIIGAGVSGIGAACHLRRNNPDHSFLIVEARPSLGGTWDLFRYPGVRSDSDMYTYAYSFKPWIQDRDIATGESILRYLEETVDEYDLRPAIRFAHRVSRVSWSSDRRRWTARVIPDQGDAFDVSCDFLITCTGYYDYRRGYQPEFAGLSSFGGAVVHAQHWPDDLQCADRRVVVIGSGATAATVVPALTERGATVTMLQRSPSYFFSRPSVDAIAMGMRRVLPSSWAYRITRWRNILIQRVLFYWVRWRPEAARRWLRRMTTEGVGPDVDVDVHFNPRYRVWDQRVCLIPDNDFYDSVRTGKAKVVTDTIDHFDETGLVLASGERIDADVVVMATGLQLRFLGGIDMDVDGTPVDPGQLVTYRGFMFAGIPNWVSIFGYTSASWTLKVDLVASYVCRLLRHMRSRGYDTVVAEPDARATPQQPLMASIGTAGYIQRGGHLLPKQGEGGPWLNSDDYLTDLRFIAWASLNDRILRFGARPAPKAIEETASVQ